MFIIRSSNKKEPNWSGKEWSDLPCKIYSSFEDACDALKHYWFGGYNLEGNRDNRRMTIIPITEDKKIKLINAGEIRW